MSDPLQKLGMRPTYRSLCVLAAIGDLDGRESSPSNRKVATAAGINDEGQESKLLKRLEGFGLIENARRGPANGKPNAWRITPKGIEIQRELEAWEWD